MYCLSPFNTPIVTCLLHVLGIPAAKVCGFFLPSPPTLSYLFYAFGLVWFGLVWFGLVWFPTVEFEPKPSLEIVLWTHPCPLRRNTELVLRRVYPLNKNENQSKDALDKTENCANCDQTD